MVPLAIGVLVGGGIGAAVGYFRKCFSGTCALTATPWRGMLFGAMVGAFVVYSFGFGSKGSSEADKGAREGGMLIETREDFREFVLEAEGPVLVDFFSPTCPPCRKLAPRISSIRGKYKGRAGIYKVNVSETLDIARPYHVRSIPTVIFFRNGEETDRVIGNRGKRTYSRILDRMIKANEDLGEKSEKK